MKSLNEQQIQIINTALQRDTAYHNKVISQFYLDDDQGTMVSESDKILRQITDIQPYFQGNKPIHILTERDMGVIKEAFNRSDEIYNNNDDYIMKASLYLALIDTIKAVLRKEDE